MFCIVYIGNIKNEYSTMGYIAITLLVFVIIVFVALFCNNVEVLLATITIVATALIIANIIYRNVYDDVDQTGQKLVINRGDSGNVSVKNASKSDGEGFSSSEHGEGFSSSEHGEGFASGDNDVTREDYINMGFFYGDEEYQNKKMSESEKLKEKFNEEIVAYPSAYEIDQNVPGAYSVGVNDAEMMNEWYGSSGPSSSGGWYGTSNPYSNAAQENDLLMGAGASELQNTGVLGSNSGLEDPYEVIENFGQLRNGFDYLQMPNSNRFHNLYDKSYGSYTRDHAIDIEPETASNNRDMLNMFGDGYLNKKAYLDNPVQFITPGNLSVSQYNKTNCKPDLSSSLNTNYLNKTLLNDPTSTGTGNYLMQLPKENTFIELTPRIFLGDDTSLLQYRDQGTDTMEGIIGGILSGRDYQSRYWGEILDNEEIRRWWGNLSYAVGDN
jgi:hypothetical protein